MTYAPVPASGTVSEPSPAPIFLTTEPPTESRRPHRGETGTPTASTHRPDAARRQTTLNALEVATSWAAWESLRSELRLSTPEAQQVVLSLTSNLLTTH